MKAGYDPGRAEEELGTYAENISPFENGKRNDCVYFRMDTPSQLSNEYEFMDKLGEGTFGVVYRGRRKSDNAKCAIKKILREREFSASERARLDREISILRLVKHPGIIELFAVAESPKIIFLIMELCEGDTLAHWLDILPPQTGFEEWVVVEITRQAACALSYLHNRGIVHRDLKAGNIMLLHQVTLCYRKLSNISTSSNADNKRTGPQIPVITDIIATNAPRKPSPTFKTARTKNNKATVKHSAPVTSIKYDEKSYRNGQPSSSTPVSGRRKHNIGRKDIPISRSESPPELRIKLIDFGLAIEVRKNEEVLANQCGTPLYMAPEVLTGRSYTRQCDIWSLGILMYQLLTNHFPFAAQTEDELVVQMKKFDIDSIKNSMSFVSALGQQCLARVLKIDPAYRYSASELLLDPWVSHLSTNGRDEPFLEPDVPKHSSVLVVRPKFSLQSSARESIQKNSQTNDPTSTGSTYSATNVLELMKQYHREITGNKQTEETGNSSGAC
ncbi:unnamed protein product [Calicophoron daubneyi]|uniref:Protein kinase domain-containing protein n=1 Tax=Calicophoron daubneyi TaxID=300641 RepID=A0AAV2THT4_CALDB